jgi:hypothetical protein
MVQAVPRHDGLRRRRVDQDIPAAKSLAKRQTCVLRHLGGNRIEDMTWLISGTTVRSASLFVALLTQGDLWLRKLPLRNVECSKCMTNVPWLSMGAVSSVSSRSTAMGGNQRCIRAGKRGISGLKCPGRIFSLTLKTGRSLRMREQPKWGKRVARRRFIRVIDFGLTNYRRDLTFVFSQVADGTLNSCWIARACPQGGRCPLPTS